MESPETQATLSIQYTGPRQEQKNTESQNDEQHGPNQETGE